MSSTDDPYWLKRTATSTKILLRVAEAYANKTYIFNWCNGTSFSATTDLSVFNKEPTGGRIMVAGMGWKEAESADVAVRVKKSKKKKVEQVKDVKRLTMGPKASRWR